MAERTTKTEGGMGGAGSGLRAATVKIESKESVNRQDLVRQRVLEPRRHMGVHRYTGGPEGLGQAGFGKSGSTHPIKITQEEGACAHATYRI